MFVHHMASGNAPINIIESTVILGGFDYKIEDTLYNWGVREQ